MADAIGLQEMRRPASPPADGPATEWETWGLLATVDLDEDGRRLAQVPLAYADYAGLQAEYEGDTGTTTLNSSLDTAIGALPAAHAENLPSSYASFLKHTVAWTP